MPATDSSLRFAEGLTAKFADQPGVNDTYAVMPGKTWDRIVRLGPEGRPSSVHAFVNRDTGAVYKSDGFRKPAPHERYPNVEAALAEADPFGSYLYL